MVSATLEQARATDVTALLNKIAIVGEALSQKKTGAREKLIEIWRAEHPEIQKAFNNHMAGYVEGHGWTMIFIRSKKD